ncbi:YceI family protein [Methyloligella sp. 2.7D]|uniref:YceI family protein n=1 Tax=unclassified Methyloligella TaxID=2625955 RepID=UPI00157CDFC1|nr:YceI family protein [Methyloligella sp. GL2]QKP77707.1 polyisoprenoid-binding protein [Methyloligella sp. GL2]
MRHALFAAGLALAPIFAVLPAQATEYTLDPGHTQVRFGWTHFGFSGPEANFDDVTGTLNVDEDDPAKSTVEVTIPVKSIDTHVPALDEHLLTKPEFFKVEEYPEITFKSTKVRNISDNKKRFEVVGDLTVNGITKEVVLKSKLNKHGEHPMYGGAEAAGFDATTTLKRSDFGMDAFVPNVSDKLKVRITTEAIEADAYAKKLEEMKAKEE